MPKFKLSKPKSKLAVTFKSLKNHSLAQMHHLPIPETGNRVSDFAKNLVENNELDCPLFFMVWGERDGGGFQKTGSLAFRACLFSLKSIGWLKMKIKR